MAKYKRSSRPPDPPAPKTAACPTCGLRSAVLVHTPIQLSKCLHRLTKYKRKARAYA